MGERMKVAYIAGPVRAATKRQVWLNTKAAAEVGITVARFGYAVIVPHTNSRLPELLGNLGDEYWLAMDLEVLRRCDLVVLVPGWRSSVGTQKEVELARSLGIPVYELADLMAQNG